MARRLQPGFVVTNEPGIYFIPELIDIWKTEHKYPEFIDYQKVDEYRDFGGIRMWGTAGWCVVAWLFGYVWVASGPSPEARLPHALYVSALASCALAAYSFTLPRSQSHEEKPSTLAYWKALKIFGQPTLILLCAMTFVNGMVHQFYYFGMSPYLKQSGYASQHIMPAMSLGQASEVVVLGLLGVCMVRLGYRKTMAIGAITQAVRCLIFAYGHSRTAILIGIGLHGLCYAFFFTAAYIYVDNHSTADTRAGAQQLFTILISGAGPLVGFLMAGYTAQFLTAPATGLVNYQIFWTVPAVMGVGVAVVMAVFFRPRTR